MQFNPDSTQAVLYEWLCHLFSKGLHFTQKQHQTYPHKQLALTQSIRLNSSLSSDSVIFDAVYPANNETAACLEQRVNYVML